MKWHKWPEEKPADSGRYLIWADKGPWTAEYDCTWEWIRYWPENPITHWTELGRDRAAGGSMKNPPRTREEAQKLMYPALWGTHKYVRTCCAWAVNNPRGCQCSRKPGYGPEGLYCRQHAAKIKETR